MNDLDICKRIAEIEGLNNHISDNKKHIMVKDMSTPALRWIKFIEYNPLTDDALCFRLMIKYGYDFCQLQSSKLYMVHTAMDKTVTDANPNKAICLAIIKAHKVKQ